MNRLHRFSIKHPLMVILIAVLVTLAIAPGILRLKLRTDGLALVPKGAPATLLNESVREEFGVNDLLVVLVRSNHPDGIFNTHTVRLVRDLTADIQGLQPYVASDVVGLATELSDRFKPGTLSYFPLLDPLPTTPDHLALLRDDIEANRLYQGTIVSRDKKATAIQVEVPPGVDRVALYREIDRLVEQANPTNETIEIIGAPVAEALLGRHILEDLGVPKSLLGYSTKDAADLPNTLPRSLYELRTFVGRYVGLVPIALLIMAIVFLLSFRGLVAMALPLLEVGACLFAVFGIMGWCGVPVYLTIAVLPVILTAIALADEVHIFTRYAQERRQHPADDISTSVHATMDEMARPVVRTSITTSVGFLSFAVSPIGPVSAFGIFMAVGILFCMMWSLTVIPALLVLLKPKGVVPFGRGATTDTGGRSRRPPLWLVGTGSVGRYLVLGVAAVVVLTTPFGVDKLIIQDSWIGGFAEESRFYKATQYFNEQFLGTHILHLRLETERVAIKGEIAAKKVGHHMLTLPRDIVSDPAILLPGCVVKVSRDKDAAVADSTRTGAFVRLHWSSVIDTVFESQEGLVIRMPRTAGSPKFFLRPAPEEQLRYEITSQRFVTPDALKLTEKLTDFVESKTERTVGGVIGPADYVAMTNFIVKRRVDGSDMIPDDVKRNHWLLGQYSRIRGEERLREVVGPDYDTGLISVFMKNANFVDTAHLMNDIEEFEREHLRPEKIDLDFAGDVAVSQTLIDAIVTTQIRSLLLSLIGILVVTVLLSRSIRWGIYCVIPCALAVLVNFAVMGWLQIPLGVATTMFAGMTLGIGIDFAIHLIHRFRLACSNGLEGRAAWLDTLQAVGPAIVINSLAVALGFGVLLLSQVPANARLGGITIVCVASCLAATLFLLPAIAPKGREAGPPEGGPA